ncbi:MAG: hypothetical protein JWO05_3853 [Gemmatimonadetes bacterium]|nr:hypothetical protein [Gemmatimonadota bacterium]
MGTRRLGARYACAVVEGIVLEVYTIIQWHPAGSTDYETRIIDLSLYGGRFEFTGGVATESIRSEFVGRSVALFFKMGAANPILYLNC